MMTMDVEVILVGILWRISIACMVRGYILRAGQNESFSREERLCGVRRPFSFFKDFFLLAALWIRQKLGKN